MTSVPSDVEAPKFKPLKRLQITEQRLKSWRPILPQKQGIVLTAVTAAVLIAVGLIFFFAAKNQCRYVQRYDNKCEIGKECVVELDVTERMTGRIELKYELTKFYQNHRRYGYSRVDDQLMGKYVDYDGMLDCSIYRSTDNSENPDSWILPCGLFALSVFNDSFVWNGNHPFTEQGIAYDSELEHLFKDLSPQYTTGYKWLDNQTNVFPGGTRDEHFIVWMRTAFIPKFSKLYALCDDCTIEPGRYNITVSNRYPTDHFQGEKRIVLEEITKMGPRNLYLGIAYVACGIVCGIHSIAILIMSILKPRQIGEGY